MASWLCVHRQRQSELSVVSSFEDNNRFGSVPTCINSPNPNYFQKPSPQIPPHWVRTATYELGGGGDIWLITNVNVSLLIYRVKEHLFGESTVDIVVVLIELRSFDLFYFFPYVYFGNNF